jgi:O-antigen/teichoic acid export membrane protein
VTIAQLGMVNSLFRFALEREGEGRWQVVRTAIGFIAVVGVFVAFGMLLLTPVIAHAALQSDQTSLWYVSCIGLWIALVYEPMVGLYRVEQRPRRFLVITIVNVAVTIAASLLGVVLLHERALGLVAGSYAGTAVALVVVAVDRRQHLFGAIDRAVILPMLRFGLPFMPSRLALWALNLANRLILTGLVSVAAAGVLGFGVRIAQVVALMVTAFQLAWPPFAYAIKEDGEARRVYRAVLTYWMLIASWVVLGLALLRNPIVHLITSNAHFWPAANPMAITAAGIGFYGGYYVVGVAVGRVKQTQYNWIVTGIAAVVSVVLCFPLINRWGPSGAAAATAIAYALMCFLMANRAERVFPVGYEWRRILLLLGVAAGLFAVGDQVLPQLGAAGVAGRLVLALVYPALLLAAGFFRPEERRRLRRLTAAL